MSFRSTSPAAAEHTLASLEPFHAPGAPPDDSSYQYASQPSQVEPLRSETSAEDVILPTFPNLHDFQGDDTFAFEVSALPFFSASAHR
jgi:hypothetical protein